MTHDMPDREVYRCAKESPGVRPGPDPKSLLSWKETVPKHSEKQPQINAFRRFREYGYTALLPVIPPSAGVHSAGKTTRDKNADGLVGPRR